MFKAKLPWKVSLIAALLTFIGFLAVPVISLAAPSSENHELPINAKTKYKIVSFTLPAGLALGEKLKGEAVIRNEGDAGGTALVEVRINGKLSSLYDIELQPGEESHYPIRLSFEKMGVYTIEVKTAHDSRKQDVTVGPGAEEEETPPPATTPPMTGGSPISLAVLDTDKNCRIDDSEFFTGIDRWVTSGITDSLFFTAVDAWIGQASICAASSSIATLSFHSQTTKNAITFSVQGQAVITLGVQIFDLTGKLLFNENSSGRQLRWNMRQSNGLQIANGVYLYVVTAQDVNGTISRSAIKKLIVLR